MAELKQIPGLRAKLGAVRARLGRLAFARAFWPVLLFIAVYLAVALLGGFQRLPSTLAAGTTLAGFLIAALLLVRGLRVWQRPSADDARDLLDRQSDLRPVSGLLDRPAASHGPAQALWNAHARRLRGAVADLKTPNFWKDWRRLDPAFLRFALPVLLIGLFVAAGSQTEARLRSALVPNLGALAGADALRVEAWITPPEHTGRPPIFLEAGMGEIRVPAGSQVTLRAFHRAAPELVLETEAGREKTRFEDTPDGAYEVRTTLMGDTRISVHWWGERTAWSVLASPDSPPIARFVGLPSLTTKDEMEFEWAVEDDYGVRRLELAISLREPHPAAPDAEDRLPVSLGGVAPKLAEDTALLDTMRHRWAGLPVDVQLVAIDGAGQEGRSEIYPFVLPEKLLLQPLAKAAQEIRVTVLREPRAYGVLAANPEALAQGGVNTAATRRLDAAPPDVQMAAAMLDGLTLEPARYFEDRSVYFGLRMAHSILTTAPDKAEADTIDTLLWQVALKAEYGSAADALRALLAARRALEQALRDGASEDEIRRLMEAFKEAANNYIAAKMAEAMINGNEAPNMSDMAEQGGGGGLGSGDFQEMLDALSDLAETGATDQARQLLSDITNMLENLEFQQGGAGSGDGFAMPGGEGGEPGEDEEMTGEQRELTDALEALSDLLREQRELNDDTLAEQRGEGPSQSGEGTQGGQPGQEGEGQIEGLGDRQRGLAKQAERLSRGIGPGGEDEDGGEGAAASGEPDGEETGTAAIDDAARRRLEDIARLQERAARELERGREDWAGRLQEEATGQLRDLSAELAARLDEIEEAMAGDRTNADSDQVDPFGRPIGGPGVGDGVAIPDEAERQRAKDILDELRRRYEDAEDAEEQEYLERLLDRF
ncbi:MAG: DUF4175 domain-containing protein [Hyphomonadaceae bacterium]|nr:DUF4175 domain-containing protein [Hyphomonadaceae bacterium]